MVAPLMRFSGRTIVVTVPLALRRRAPAAWPARGAGVVVLSRDAEECANLVSGLEGDGHRWGAVDLTDLSATTSAPDGIEPHGLFTVEPGPEHRDGGAFMAAHCMRRIFGATALGVLLVWPLPTLALEEPVARRVDEYVQSEIASLEVPGAAVVIVEGTEIVFARGYGTAGPDREAVTPATPFHLASVSKSLTALAVAQQIDAGNLALDDPLSQLLPDLIPNGSEAGEISVANLLGHTSGWTEYDGLTNRVRSDSSGGALEANVRRLIETPPSNGVGEYEYSNANYDVLGYLVERASGQTFAEYMAEQVFGPLQMTHSFASESAVEAGGVADGHYPFFGVVRPRPLLFIPGSEPSAFLAASAEDLGHFLIAQLNGGQYEGVSVVNDTALLHEPISRPNLWEGYAFGLSVYPLWTAGQLSSNQAGNSYQLPVILEHGGDHESFASSILLLPEHRFGVVVLFNVNDESVPSRYHQLHIGIANVLLGLDPPATVAYEGAVERYAKWIYGGIVLFLLARAAVSFLRLRRIRAAGNATSARPLVRYVLVPSVLDLLLVSALWYVLIDESGAPLTVVRRSVPDIFLAAVVATVVALGWAVVRTILTRQTLLKRVPATVRR